MTDETIILNIAQSLKNAERTRTEVEPITVEHPTLTHADSYAIQNKLMSLYGVPIIGIKAALTSKAKQKAMGVDEPGYGILLDFMYAPDNVLQTSELIHPRVEPEIAVFFEDFVPRPNLTAADIREMAYAIAPAVEVIDSRYKNFKFSAIDVFADNSSSSRYFLSEERWNVDTPELNLLAIIMQKNGVIMQTGTPAAVMGSPFAATAFILNSAIANGVELPRSFVALSGGITDAIPVQTGDVVRVTFGETSAITIQVK